MRIKDGFQLRDVAGTVVAMQVETPVESTEKSYNNMLLLNDVGAFLWKQMEHDTTEEKLCTLVLSEYEVEQSRACSAVHEFVRKLRQEGLLEE